MLKKLKQAYTARISTHITMVFCAACIFTKPVLAQIIKTDSQTIKAQKIASFSHPWGMAMLPNGNILVTEREGKLWLVNPNTGEKTQISGLPRIVSGAQGGLLDIAISPNFAQSRKIFFSFTEAFNIGTGTAIGSAILPDTKALSLSKVQTIFSMNKGGFRGQHFGSRIVTAGDGTLFFTIGDRGESHRAQDPFDHAGSVLRINQDGSIPKDNPFADGKNGAPQIWSIGHRNPQGAAKHPVSGKLYTVEHGARGGDEINTPLAGKNYGWPVISYGKNYSGTKIGEGTQKTGMEQPLYYWDPSIAPSGMAFSPNNTTANEKFPNWKGSLFVGALKDQKIVRLQFKNENLEPVENLFEDMFGRIRDVRFFNQGNMWILTDEDPGALIKISPAN